MKYNKSGARLAQELLYGFLTKKRMFRRGGGIVLIIVPLQMLKKKV